MNILKILKKFLFFTFFTCFFLLNITNILYAREKAIFSLSANNFDADQAIMLEQAKIFIGNEEYKYDNLPEQLYVGWYRIKCIYQPETNKTWISDQTIRIYEGQSNIIFVKFKKKLKQVRNSLEIMPITKGVVHISTTPDRLHNADINITSMNNMTTQTYKKRTIKLEPGEYSIFVTSEGYEKSRSILVNVVSGDFHPLHFKLEEFPYTKVMLNISPDIPHERINLLIKNLDRADHNEIRYTSNGFELEKGIYFIEATSKSFKPVSQKIEVKNGQRLIYLDINFEPIYIEKSDNKNNILENFVIF